MTIRIVVVDGKNTRRGAMISVINKNNDYKVISDLRKGSEALDHVKKLLPDLVLVGDVLHDQSGYSFIMELMKHKPTAALIVVDEDIQVEVDYPKALDFGIVDSIGLTIKNSEIIFASRIKHRINVLSKLKVSRFQFQIDQIINFKTNYERPKLNSKQIKVKKKLHQVRESVSTPKIQAVKDNPPFYPRLNNKKKVIVIGASTGGPKMLNYIISHFPLNFPPVLVVQHMPSGFVNAFAERMNSFSKMNVKMAKEGDIVKSGHVYVAPGGYHMELDNLSGVTKIKITEGAKVNFVKPAVDVTLFSAVRCYGPGVIGVILTGMGSDGREGCRIVKKQNGKVFALNEEDSIIYGMNKAVIDAGLADEILGMDRIAPTIGITLKK
ncbi:MAG: response regulator [Candidatus Heimdallarchaeota archaeon]|nr:response regulator [Candidatus Heimdallarchaeota archaeon]